MMSVRFLPSLALMVVAAFGLVGCGDSAKTFFPTWSPSGDPVPTGALQGRLVERNGCLLWADEREYLPIWPEPYELDGATILVDSRPVIRVGDTAFLGGGMRSLGGVESLIGEQVPQRCQAAGGYWLVTRVEWDLGG